MSELEKETSAFQEMKTFGSFEIEPVDRKIDFSHGYTQLLLSKNQKKQLTALYSNLPSMMSANVLSQTYVVKFPEGLPHSLTQLKQGGYGTMIRGEHGRFVGSASLHPTISQASFVGIFSAMSIASGQYYLAEINKDLSAMKQNIDKILEFLYGDKRAELISEVSFVKYAYQNYSSIMEHDTQATATISSLQNAKKVAMKDIEFYMSDLDATVNAKPNADIVSVTEKALRIKESLELSMQLYGMSCVLETYFSQNHDSGYIEYIDSEISYYIDKCEKRMLSSFSILYGHINEYKGSILKKLDKTAYEKEVSDVIEKLHEGSDLRKVLQKALRAETRPSEYYVADDGIIYLKTS